MVMADVCYLITDLPGAHGVHGDRGSSERQVYCEVKSVTRNEYYQAHIAGLQPGYVLKLSIASEYWDETKLRFRDHEYRILRTYITRDGGIELTIQRSDING
jgi:SPP1 family predicted phage head-tail adaptor